MKNIKKSKTPAMAYGSGGYLLLCFGKSRGKPFSISVAADVLAGKFRRTSDARTAARSLEKNGFLKNVDEDVWVITESGYEKIEKVAYNHRETMHQLLGKRYIEQKSKEMRFGALTSLDGFMDDQILEELYLRTIQAKRRKSSNRKDKS